MKINQFTHTKKIKNKDKNTKNQKIMIYISLELMKIKFLQKIKNKKKRKILQKKRTRNSKKNNSPIDEKQLWSICTKSKNWSIIETLIENGTALIKLTFKCEKNPSKYSFDEYINLLKEKKKNQFHDKLHTIDLFNEYFPKELVDKTYEKFNKDKRDFEMVSQSQKDILNSFYNYEIIFDKKNESKKIRFK